MRATTLPEGVYRKLYFVKSAAGIFAHAGAGVVARDPLGFAITYKRRQLGRLLRHELIDGLSYFVGGCGPTLVLIHGFSDQAGTWADTVAMLRRAWRVIVLDLPGHGESSPPPSPYANDLEGQYQGLARTLELLVPSHERVTLVGNSMGGGMALLHALRCPQQVEQLVLINSAGLRHPVDRSLLMPTRRDMMHAKVAALMGSERTPKLPGPLLDALMALNSGFMEELFERLSADDSFEDSALSQIQAPATLIWGQQDPIFPTDYAERMAALLPDSELIVEPRWAHSPQMSHPDELAPVLEDAIARRIRRVA